MKVLIVGGGGREHALAWKVARSSRVERVFVAPGNAGTAAEEKVENVPVAAENIDALLEFALEQQIHLTIIGPEVPLVAGIVDRFTEAGLRCFGPGAAAARLEGSKAFMKDFLARHGIPTARYGHFSEVDDAVAFARTLGAPLVVKADGLAAGKGVIVAGDLREAEQTIRGMLTGGDFGAAGRTVVVEEFLRGEEASFIAMVDGQTILPLATSQDHKTRDEGDVGPNTGGMGAYSPAPVVTGAVHDRIMNDIMRPTVDGLAAEGSPYVGFLYAGVMIDPSGTPRVLEFNCRFGDPETQPVLLRLRSDLVSLCDAALDGALDSVAADWDPRPSVGVVMAAGGYPGGYRNGDVVKGLDGLDGADTKVFHAGTAVDAEGQVITAGGRVLCAVALGDSVDAARQRAYQLVDRIRFRDACFRRDIGHRAVAREQRRQAEADA